MRKIERQRNNGFIQWQIELPTGAHPQAIGKISDA